MSDRLTKEQRHKNMSAIRGKNTMPELLVRKYLFSLAKTEHTHPLRTA